MKRKSLCLLALSLCLIFSFSGCRKRVAETEPQSETTSESETQSESETKKETDKKTTTTESDKKTSTTESDKKTVKPSTVSGNGNNSTTTPKKNTGNTNTTGNTQTTATQMCPYCYNQISTAPNGDGTTVYSVHVAQEKAWADTYGYGTDTPNTTTPTTEAPATTAGDSAQCPYCYQWYSTGDGTYNAHLASHNSNLGSDYINCPLCGNTYAKGVEYDTHYCAGAQ